MKNMPFVILCQCNINAHCAVLSVICLYLYFRMLLVCLRMCSIFVFVRALPTLYCALDFARGKKGVHSYGNFSLKRVYTCAMRFPAIAGQKCLWRWSNSSSSTDHHQTPESISLSVISYGNVHLQSTILLLLQLSSLSLTL